MTESGCAVTPAGACLWRLRHLQAARVLIRINLIGIGQSSHARKCNNSLKGPNEALATGDDISREEQKNDVPSCSIDAANCGD
jgi:hypothetical protein